MDPADVDALCSLGLLIYDARFEDVTEDEGPIQLRFDSLPPRLRSGEGISVGRPDDQHPAWSAKIFKDRMGLVTVPASDAAAFREWQRGPDAGSAPMVVQMQAFPSLPSSPPYLCLPNRS